MHTTNKYHAIRRGGADGEAVTPTPPTVRRQAMASRTSERFSEIQAPTGGGASFGGVMLKRLLFIALMVAFPAMAQMQREVSTAWGLPPCRDGMATGTPCVYVPTAPLPECTPRLPEGTPCLWPRNARTFPLISPVSGELWRWVALVEGPIVASLGPLAVPRDFFISVHESYINCAAQESAGGGEGWDYFYGWCAP